MTLARTGMISIHQPSYFPWLGLLHKIANSDTFILMDEVQLADRAYQHRNLVLTVDGAEKFLTVTINKKDYREKRLCEIQAVEGWQQNHMNFLAFNYRKHPFFKEIMERLEPMFAQRYERLIDAVHRSMLISFELFDIHAKVVLQSEMTYDRSLKKGDLIIGLVKAAGYTRYLSGSGVLQYSDPVQFEKEGLELHIDRFIHPVYAQLNTAGKEFKPGMACIDILFNLGIDGSRELLKTTLV